MRRVAAFSLGEFLLALGVLSILAALLLPALVGMRQRAQTQRCVANLQQIGVGLSLYAQDHGSYPPFGWYGDMTRWFDGSADPDSFFAGPYLRSAPRLKRVANPATGPTSKGSLFDCPALKNSDKQGRGTADWVANWFDYGLNLTLCGRRPNAIGTPSRTVALVEGGHYGRVKAQWTHGLTYSPDQPANPGGTAWNYTPSPILYPHQGKAHFLFLDGHVAPHAASELAESWFNGAL